MVACVGQITCRKPDLNLQSKEGSPEDNEDDRSPMAKAMSMVGTITAISMSMVVMALIGWGVDTWLGTQIVFMFIGVVLGVVGGVWQLIKILS